MGRRFGLIALFALCALCALPASAEIRFGEPRILTSPDLRPASLSQELSSAASSGDEALVVWIHDGRFVLCARFGRDGEALDASPLVIAGPATLHFARAPVVVWSGAAYIVVWIGDDSMIRYRTVSREGAPGPVRAIVTEPGVFGPRVARFDDRVLVTARTISTDGRQSVVGAVLSRDASILSGPRELGSFDDFDVAGVSGGGFLLVGTRVDLTGNPDANGFPSSVHALPIDTNGTPLPEQLVARADRAVFGLQVAASDDSILAIWSTNRGVDGEVRTMLIEPNGAATEPTTIHKGPMNNQTLTSIGSGYVATLGDGVRIQSLSLDQMGEVVGTPAESTRPGLPALTASSAARIADRALLMVETRQVVGDVYGLLLDETGTALSSAPFWLVTSPARQTAPSGARGASSQLVAWLEERPHEGRWAAVAAVVDDSGAALATTTLGSANPGEQPRVASNGESYAVVWRDVALNGEHYQSILRAVLVSSSGEILENRSLEIPRGQQRGLAIVRSNGAYLVAFMHETGYLTNSLSAIRLGPDLSPSSELFTIDSDLRGNALSMSATANGVIALFGGIPMRHSLIRHDGSMTPPIELSFYSLSVDQDGGLAAWIVREHETSGRVEWGTVSDHGVTSIGSIARPPRATPATPHTRLSVAKWGDHFMIAWDEGDPGNRVLQSLIVDSNGTQVSVPVRAHARVGDIGSPEVIGTAYGVLMVHEAVDTAFGTPGLSRVYTRTVTDEPPVRHRGARRQ